MVKGYDYFNVVAFDSKWQYKGIVDPSIRDGVVWIRADSAIDFIKNNKPKDEHWLIEMAER